MIWNKHSNLEGQHAFLGASKYHWINYDDEKLCKAYGNFRANERGTELHDFAKRAIELGVKLSRAKTTLNMYVNDAIGFLMRPEQLLYYSRNCFGTADAISFDENKKILRIHDLKTGITPANIMQLKIYAALFFLEYATSPMEMKLIELRIYQDDSIIVEQPDPQEIRDIMTRIIEADKIIESLRVGDEM